MNEVKKLNLSVHLNGLKELSEKLDEMNLHITKAISIAEEIAEIEFTATTNQN